MGGMSIWHLIIIAFILLMVFGPSRIGEMGGSLGKAIRNFKKGIEGVDEIDVTQTIAQPLRKEQLSAAPPANAPGVSVGVSVAEQHPQQTPLPSPVVPPPNAHT